tara:strand:+ start:3763 stop:4101 length:339 start_codon:yes stop_codon:yes gene_type:complete
MARKPNKTKQDQDAAQQPVDPEKVETSEAETQPETAVGEQNDPETQPAAEPQSETAGPEEQEGKPAARTKARMVEATLKTRHCRGGICKEAGETMLMTQGEYDRLKKYDRVE